MLNQFEDGGAERQLLELIKRLDRNRFRPLLFIGSAAGTITSELDQLDIPVRHVRGRIGSKLAFLSLIRQLKQEQVDIVHGWMFVANVWARVAGRLAGVPVIITSERGLDTDLPEYYRWLDVALNPLSTRVVVNAMAVADHAHRNRLVPRAKIVNIYNGVDLDLYGDLPAKSEARGRIDVPGSVPLLGMVASFGYRKRWDLFLQAVARVAESTEVLALAVGDGTLRGEMERYAGELGIKDKVKFLGLRPDIPEIMAALDVFVLSSDDEGMPNVVMQAMAASRPVVATDAGGTRELVEEGATGFVVPKGDASLLADRVASLIAEPALAAKFGRAGRQRVEDNFTFEACVEKTESLYQALAARHAA